MIYDIFHVRFLPIHLVMFTFWPHLLDVSSESLNFLFCPYCNNTKYRILVLLQNTIKKLKHFTGRLYFCAGKAHKRFYRRLCKRVAILVNAV